jgi:hypothetical protein
MDEADIHTDYKKKLQDRITRWLKDNHKIYFASFGIFPLEKHPC